MRKLKNLLFLVVILTALDVNAFKMEDGPMTIGDRVKPEASSILMLESKTLGLLPPRMTEAERDAIVAPANGLSIYNTDTLQWNTFNGAIWGPSSGGGGADHPLWTPSTLFGIGAIVVDDVGAFKVYRANTAHTSDPVVFINDIANWDELSDLTLLGGTQGAVNFLDATSKISEDPTDFFWDSAANKLSIGTDTALGALTLSGAGSLDSTIEISTYSNNLSNESVFRSSRALGTEAAPARVQANTALLDLKARAHNGTVFEEAVGIEMNSVEDFSSVLGSTEIIFYTSPTGIIKYQETLKLADDFSAQFVGEIQGPRIIIDSTTEGSRPCPDMTEAQRDAIGSPTASDCVYNTTTNKWNVFDGTVWGEVGGGLSKWTPTTAFVTDEVVWEAATRKIYRSLADFTSGGAFVPGNWEEIGIPSPGDGLEFVGATTVFRVQLDTTGVNSEPYLERSAANGMRAKVLDEDNLVSDSDLHLATQQSIKAYVDSTTGALAPTFQDVYDNSAPAVFTLDGTNNGLEIRDNGTPIGVNLFSIEDSASAVEYFKVDVNATNTLALNTTGVHTVSGQSDIDDVTINGNTISTNNGNLPLLLTPDGTGQIEASSDFVFKASALFDEIASTASTIGATQHALRFDSTSSIFLKENNAGDILPVDFNEFDETNLLLNRLFAKATAGEDWALVAGSMFNETTIKLGNGGNSLRIELTAQTLDFSQVISIDQYDQKFVEFSCDVNSTEDLLICPMGVGGEITSQCINTIGNDNFVRYGARVQVISGSNFGYKVKSSGPITDSVYVTSCGFTSDTKMFIVDQEENEFHAEISQTGVVSGEGAEFINGNCTESSGLYTCTLTNTSYANKMICTTGKDNSANPAYVPNFSNSPTQVIFRTKTDAGAQVGVGPNYISCKLSGSDYHAPTTFVSTPSTSNLTDWKDYTPVFTGFGSVSNVNFRFKQIGDTYQIQGKFQSGTSTAVEAQITLPNGKSIKTGVVVGVGGIFLGSVSSSTKGGAVLITGGDAFLNLGDNDTISGVTDTPLVPAVGSIIVGSGNQISLFVTVPIEGLSSNNNFLSNVPVPLVCYIKDVKSNGTNGGGCDSTLNWQTRDLNTLSGDCSQMGITLSANQIIMALGGEYQFTGSAPAYHTQIHKTKLRNITGSTDDIIGTSEFALFIQNNQTRSDLIGKVDVDAGDAFEIQHRCSTTVINVGFGTPSSFSVDEVYTQLEIWKVNQ